jgi:hypothetical protein
MHDTRISLEESTSCGIDPLTPSYMPDKKLEINSCTIRVHTCVILPFKLFPPRAKLLS